VAASLARVAIGQPAANRMQKVISRSDFAVVDPMQPIRGHGERGWFGWAKSEKREALRAAWFGAPDLAAQQRLFRKLQSPRWRKRLP